MNGETESKKGINDLHVQMWKHYDDLRQKKNATFLTANTILVAAATFSSNNAPQLITAISALGIVIQIAWFLLLTRNGAYISLHRGLLGAKWEPVSKTPRSSVLDRTLPVVFGVFWAFLLAQKI
jgi:hypothetical protein